VISFTLALSLLAPKTLIDSEEGRTRDEKAFVVCEQSERTQTSMLRDVTQLVVGAAAVASSEVR
jgi:hypothetical protein